MRRKEIMCGIILAALFSSGLANAQFSDLGGPFFSLTILVTPGDAFDYGVYIIKYLKDINIDAKIKVMNYDCNEPNSFPKINTNWDLAVCSYKGGGKSPDMRDLFTENGSQNIFNLNNEIPYQNDSEYLQNVAASTFDLDERQQLYYDWQQLIMKNIVPILPLFSPRYYNTIWDNTECYDMRWGFSRSSPYMSYSGLHEGQDSADEFNVVYNKKEKQRFSFAKDYFNWMQWELISEPIIQWSPDNAPLKTGLIDDWEELENSYYKFYMRENIFWNPSFSVINRSASSAPLLSETSPGVWEVTDPGILIPGLKTGEVSTGMNQQVTAKDAVFTLLAVSNPLTSRSFEEYDWLSNCYVDPSDPLSFHIKVDDNPETYEIEPKADFFSFLDLAILPEFFLNSTDDTVSLTSGGVTCFGLNETTKNSMNWISYDFSPFGCGKFMLDYYDDDPSMILTRSPFWFGIGAIDGVAGKTPFVETVNIFDITNEEEKKTRFKEGKLDLVDEGRGYCRWCMEGCCEPFLVQTEIRDILNLVAFNLEKEFIGGLSNNIWVEGPDGKNYTEACAVRKAICYAIDREEMNEVLHDGEYTLCHNPMYLYSAFYYYADVIKYYRELETAWKWMEAAGYRKNLDETSPDIMLAIICLSLIAKVFYKKKLRQKRKCS